LYKQKVIDDHEQLLLF